MLHHGRRVNDQGLARAVHLTAVCGTKDWGYCSWHCALPCLQPLAACTANSTLVPELCCTPAAAAVALTWMD